MKPGSSRRPWKGSRVSLAWTQALAAQKVLSAWLCLKVQWESNGSQIWIVSKAIKIISNICQVVNIAFSDNVVQTPSSVEYGHGAPKSIPDPSYGYWHKSLHFPKNLKTSIFMISMSFWVYWHLLGRIPDLRNSPFLLESQQRTFIVILRSFVK